jgi:hypothetical protein
MYLTCSLDSSQFAADYLFISISIEYIALIAVKDNWASGCCEAEGE